MKALFLAVVLTAVVGCTTAARRPATQTSVGAQPPREAAVLRSVVATPRCPPSATAEARPLLTTVPDEVHLNRREAVCGAATPAEVCACLAKDLAALSADFDHGPGTCEVARASSMSVQVATVFSTGGGDGVVPAVATVVIARGPAGWAAYGVAETVAEIDLAETPQMSAGVDVVGVSEAVFGAARFAWIETATTEEDVAGDERYVDATSALTICELGQALRCGRVDIAAWQYVVARDGDDGDDADDDADDDATADDDDDAEDGEGADVEGGDGDACRSAQGTALRAEQRDASSLMLTGVGGAGGSDARRLAFVRM
ncbi:MAG: hypothetical protein IPH44_33885 [Myxococcales bacterium]|nr:hypothetical protein [Myxococcales bacterium]MBK7192684.1 hypothetical protein [Myxococcales bacterium]MBP6846954.1 hypothetical protein [Kofleriaceae bacterium]